VANPPQLRSPHPHIAMNQIVVVITGLTVLAHSIFGCCAHNGVSTTVGPASACCTAVVEHAHHAHHAHLAEAGCRAHDAVTGTQVAAHKHDESDQSPTPGHQCKHENCQWVSSRGDTSVDPQGSAWYLPVSTPFATFVDLPLPGAGPNGWESERFFALALRSHIRLRVLLI
jgi:hypothetical protein